MRKGYLEIREPIWNGGNPMVGIATQRLENVDVLEIRISYRNKKGELVYPQPYREMTDRLRTKFKPYTLKDGTQIINVPISELAMVQKWHDVEAFHEEAKALDDEATPNG